jgi:hypothetical protein
MPECPICISKKRVIASCPRCATQGCRDCMLRTAIDNPLLPSCVAGCRGLSLGELQQTLGPGLFSKAFRPALRTALFKREEALIPSTMPAVEAVKRQEAAQEQLKVLQAEHDEIEGLIMDLRRRRSTLENRIWQTRQIAEAAAPQDIKTTLRCQQDGCLGCADEAGNCLACGAAHCSKCGVRTPESDHEHLVASDGDGAAAAAPAPHVCDPNEVASMRAIAESAKPCPSCGAPTTRISGCPQMWCTYCRTGYRYDTLRISKGPVGNPERDDYIRRYNGTVPRQPGDVPCGGFESLSWREAHALQECLPPLANLLRKHIPGFIELEEQCHPVIDKAWWGLVNPRHQSGLRALARAVTAASARVRGRVLRGNGELSAMRVKLILKRMEQEDFVAALMRHDTRRRRDTEIMPIFQMYEAMVQDLDRDATRYLKRNATRIEARLQDAQGKDEEEKVLAEKIAKEVVGWYQRWLQIRGVVQEGLDLGAQHLGVKRLGRIGEDGVLRLN